MKEPSLRLWLAGPDAAALLVPDRLGEADRARWEQLRHRRKGVEWAASRALREHAAAGQAAAASLTHSSGHAALAVGPHGCRVGVDLEALAPRAVVRLAELCFAPEEARELGAAAKADSLQNFYVHWTLKEAFAKVTGLRLLPALRSCVISSSGGHWTARVPLPGPWRASVYAPRPGFVLAAVVAGGGGARGEDWACKEWPPERGVQWPRLASLGSESGGTIEAG
jgi:4'-phosphopantetheinyl transferase